MYETASGSVSANVRRKRKSWCENVVAFVGEWRCWDEGQRAGQQEQAQRVVVVEGGVWYRHCLLLDLRVDRRPL